MIIMIMIVVLKKKLHRANNKAPGTVKEGMLKKTEHYYASSKLGEK